MYPRKLHFLEIIIQLSGWTTGPFSCSTTNCFWIWQFKDSNPEQRKLQLPTMLGPAVHRRGKDIQTIRLQCARVDPTMLEELCITDPTLLGYVWLVSNFVQQLPTTRNNAQQSVQKVATYDNQQCCIHLQLRGLRDFTNTMGAIEARRLTQGCTNHDVTTTEIA